MTIGPAATISESETAWAMTTAGRTLIAAEVAVFGWMIDGPVNAVAEEVAWLVAVFIAGGVIGGSVIEFELTPVTVSWQELSAMAKANSAKNLGTQSKKFLNIRTTICLLF
jgi:hypothetical protein